MTNTTINYSWPTPDPAGLQRAEIAKIKQAIEAIDVSLKSEMDGLGSAAHKDAQANPLDTTAGRLMAVGAFGLGDQILSSVTGLNSYQTAGHFITPPSGLTSLPTGWAQGRHVVSVSGGTSYAIQTISGVSANAGRSAMRVWDGANWSNWKETVFMPDMNSAIAVAIAGLVDSSPGTLDTLKELATALGNDPNFATSMATELGKKLNANAYTAADVLAKLLTVDGAGSGLDADRLDNQDSSYYTNIPARLGYTPWNKAGDYDLRVLGGNAHIDVDGNRHLWFRTAAGVVRGLLYHDQNGSLNLQLYNTAGTFIRRMTFSEGGELYVQGSLKTDGNLAVGASTFYTDGNIFMSRYGTYLSNILDVKQDSNGRTYPRRVGGGDINFNWSGQGGQPSWIWGGNDGTNMYVYNPSNFSVNYANSAGWAGSAGNADTVDGYHATDLAQIYKGTNQDELNFPLGHTLFMATNNSYTRQTAVTVYLLGTSFYSPNVNGTPLTGTWRARGVFSSNGYLMQRVA